MERELFSSADNPSGSVESNFDFLSNEQNTPFLRSFLIDLIRRIKSDVDSIQNYTQISRGKFSDKEFGDYYYRSVNEHVEKVNIVLNSLLDFIKVHTPIQKRNSVHNILEEILKKHQSRLDEKGIKVLKKLERDLPETVVPDEQLKYILQSLLQYILVLAPFRWNLGLSTRSFVPENADTPGQSIFKKDGKYIEISFVFPGEAGSGTAAIRKEEAPDILLRFVKEIVLHNHGMLKIEADEKKTKTAISVRFPAERRKVVTYQAAN